MSDTLLLRQILSELKLITSLLKVNNERSSKQLDGIEQGLKPSTIATTIEFYTNEEGKNKKVDKMFLKASQKIPLSIRIKDAQGNDAKVDGAPQWVLSAEGMGTLKVAKDGMSAVFKPSGVVGLVKAQVMIDADLGEGVKAIYGELDIEVLSSEAVSIELSAGEPVDMGGADEEVVVEEPVAP
jgi:hypothetical protein